MLGKILVINSLIVPLFVYRLQVLLSPTDTIYHSFKKLITDFLWDNKKKSNVLYNRLIAPYEMSGLKMQDLRLKDQALKCKWVQISRFIENSLLNQLFQCFSPLAPNEFWQCNISPKDCVKWFPKGNLCFDVIKAWSHINFHRPTSSKQILHQILWFNSHIKEAGKPLMFDKWAKQGVNSISDLLVIGSK